MRASLMGCGPSQPPRVSLQNSGVGPCDSVTLDRMSEVSDRYATVSDGFTARLEGCPPDKWSAPSPCAEWTARDIVSHVVHVHRRIAARLDGSEAPAPAEDEDLVAAWHNATSTVKVALVDP